MGDQTVNLRVKCKAGQSVISQLSLALTVHELKQKLSALTDISINRLKVLHGYPPQPLHLSDGNMSLFDLKLRSGDTLIVEEDLACLKNGIQNGAVELSCANKIDDAGSGHIVDGGPQPQSYMNYQEAVNIHGEEQGILTRKCVPPNNSCLFTAIDYVMNNGERINLNAAHPMRKLVSRIVSNNRTKYNEGFLGQGNSSYCAWIIDDKNWGGAIEVSILAEHYQIEMDVIDAQTGRMDRFGESEMYPQRVFLFYDGTHYDPLAYENIEGTRVLRTKFSTLGDLAALEQALEIGAEAKASRQFTDLNAGVMQCSQCSVFARGEEEMKKHSMQTGHIRYSEVR